ncbi:MAG: hypothetical protein ACE5IL_02825 [Myxococcota bacterium]
MSDGKKVSPKESDGPLGGRQGSGPAKRSRSSSRSRGKRGRRSRYGSGAYKRRVEERLLGRGEHAARLRLEERLRAAHRTSNFQRLYREYLRAFGMPEGIDLLMLLLDLDNDREKLKVLERLAATLEGAAQEQRSLLRSRLRNLEMTTDSDAVADAASELLAGI